MKKILIIISMIPFTAFAQLDQKGCVSASIGIGISSRSSDYSTKYNDFEFDVLGGLFINSWFSIGPKFGYEKYKHTHESGSSTDSYTMKGYYYGIYSRGYGKITDKVSFYGQLDILGESGKEDWDAGNDQSEKINGWNINADLGILFLTKSGIGIEASYPVIVFSKTKTKYEDDSREDRKDKDFYFNMIPQMINVSISYYF